MSDSTKTTSWGRVDDERNVYVRDGETERLVGSFPDGTAEEALAYFERKYADLEGQITLLEARVARGSAERSVTQAVSGLQESLESPAAVGDLAALRARVATLTAKAEELSVKQQAEREAARAEALSEREAIVVQAEAIAATPEASIRWKDAGNQFEALFGAWQAAQRSGVHVSKSQADALWKRFRAARNTFDAARRKHFQEMDANNKQVRERKEQLIARAEALAPKGAEGISDYQRLLDEWKQAGRASRKLDDQLWAKFKAAGDVLYAAKAEVVAQTNEEYAENLQKKQAIIDDAQRIMTLTDHQHARTELTKVQLQWDEIGRVPRESMREIEGKLRTIEQHVAKLENDHWAATNPETKARSEGLRGQLEDSIAELERKIAEGKKAKQDVSADEAARETQRSWLAALGDA